MTNAMGLTTSEAARHLGCSISTLRRWTDAGHLRALRTPGGQRRFPRAELDRFLAEMRADQEAAARV